VVEAAAISHAPLMGGSTNTFRVEGRAEPDPASLPEAKMRGVAGEYFRVMGIPLVRGRVFTTRDDSASLPVVAMNASLARRLFGEDEAAVGERLRFYAFPETTYTIVGVVGDVKTGGLDEPAPNTIYYPHLQGAENRMTVVARVRGEPGASGEALRRAIQSIDATVPVYAIATMPDAIRASPAAFARRYPLELITVFAAAAVVLAAVGISGMVAVAVARRRRELALRGAVGATPGGLVALVMRDGLRLAVVGVALGALLTAALARLLGALLFEVSAHDARVYAVVGVALLAVASLASWIPARLAGRVAPMEALRSE
jgi:putative ABC transport system permease protein